MRAHAWLIPLLIVGLPVQATSAQQTSSPPLAHAERAFADALIHHDRAAFVALFAADAESSLTSATRGPEAIANAWLPFLIDPGTTMLLTTTEVVTSEAGDTGTSSGTFAIRGHTGNGIRTIPVGTYSIRWRLLNGEWKIAELSGSGNRTPETADRGGVGPYRFGMTREEVTRVRDCDPYSPVAITGGLECPHYRFDDREMNISFLFAGPRLHRIQLWYYEGESSVEAREAIAGVLGFLQRTTGEATITARADVPVTADGIIGALSRAPSPVGRQVVQLEICGPADGATVWFARVGRHEHGYLVMLFAQAAGR
jgi:ketosteroid isomerase-like protein